MTIIIFYTVYFYITVLFVNLSNNFKYLLYSFVSVKMNVDISSHRAQIGTFVKIGVQKSVRQGVI